ncbi:MAG: hypothetical protein ACJA2S_005780 [Cyclobacteriaceae bacterium]|jgi:hypothetical protein
MNQVKEEKIDRIVKIKIEVLNLFPPLGSKWSKNGSWKVIQNKLSNTNKTVIIWGFSVAASISILVAASINLNTSILLDSNSNEKKEISTLVITEQKIHRKHYLTKKEININAIEKLNNKYTIPTINSINSQPTFKYSLQPFVSKVRETQQNKNIISPYFALHSGSSGTYPSIGFDFKLYSKNKNNMTHLMKLGISTNFQQINYEASSKVFPLTYIHVGYTHINELTNKGWNAQLGYMVNPDSNVYKNNTVKFTLTKKLSKHLRAGPEIIFTDNLRKVYPGISIVLS